ncbi:transposase [Photorhabdus khanii NC19]|uniref:Transposase n=1 Tax=Photorhabdus khanii NC19 TaxID=1004151 RepID=W3V240_9GAMM|nr:transposase [Photorhabdus khanii NC19]
MGPGIDADHLNDDVLGRTLDALYEAGVSEVYQILAEQVIDKLGIKPQSVHLDITSFHVDGEYKSPPKTTRSALNWRGGTAATTAPTSTRLSLN